MKTTEAQPEKPEPVEEESTSKVEESKDEIEHPLPPEKPLSSEEFQKMIDKFYSTCN